MVNLVNSITVSLLSANFKMDAAGVSIGVYQSAKARGDIGAMDRAMSYATPQMASANKYASRIDDDLKKALDAAREEEMREKEKIRVKKEEEKKVSEKKENSNAADSAPDTPESLLNATGVEASTGTESLPPSPPSSPAPVSIESDSSVRYASATASSIGQSIDIKA